MEVNIHHFHRHSGKKIVLVNTTQKQKKNSLFLTINPKKWLEIKLLVHSFVLLAVEVSSSW